MGEGKEFVERAGGHVGVGVGSMISRPRRATGKSQKHKTFLGST